MTSSIGKEDYAFYEKVAQDVSRNVTFGIAVLIVTWILAQFWRSGARGLFWLTFALAVLTAGQALMVVGIGVYLYAKGVRESRWAWAGTAARAGEVGIDVLLIWLAAKAVGYQ